MFVNFILFCYFPGPMYIVKSRSGIPPACVFQQRKDSMFFPYKRLKLIIKMVEISRYVQTRNLFSGDRKESALRCKNSFIPEFHILQDMLKKKKKRHLWYSKWFIIGVRFNIFLNVFFWHSSTKLATSNPLNSHHVHVALFKLFCIYMYTLKLFHCFNGSWLGKKTWKLSWVVDVKCQLNTPLKILKRNKEEVCFYFFLQDMLFLSETG